MQAWIDSVGKVSLQPLLSNRISAKEPLLLCWGLVEFHPMGTELRQTLHTEKAILGMVCIKLDNEPG